MIFQRPLVKLSYFRIAIVALPYKAKQYGWFALKVCILAVAFFISFYKITGNRGALVQEVSGPLLGTQVIRGKLFLLLA